MCVCVCTCMCKLVYLTLCKYICDLEFHILLGVMVNKLDYQIIIHKFESHWMLHTSDFVSQLSKSIYILKIPLLM